MIDQATLSSRPKERRPFRPYGAALKMWRSKRREVLMCGPGNCVAGETQMYDPVRDEHIPIKQLYEEQRAPVVQTLWGPIQAEVPFLKGIDRLYRITTASGRSCLATGGHRLLTQYGWTFVSACYVGESILISSPCPHPSTEACAPVASLTGAPHLNHRASDYQDDCLQGFHQYDAQPQWEAGSALVVAPSLSGVLSHSRVDWHEGDRVGKQGYTSHPQSYAHLSNLGDCSLKSQTAYVESRYGQESVKHDGDWFQYASQSLNRIHLPLPIDALHPHVDSMLPLYSNWAEYPLCEVDGLPDYMLPELFQQCAWYSKFVGMSQEWWLSVLLSDVYTLSSLAPFKCDYTIQVDTVSSIEYVRTDEYFDLHVPGAEHYLAEGIWHHNTGKSRACLEKLHFCADKYPNTRMLMVRKTRTSLTQSAMVTYEQKVLPQGWLDNLIHFRTQEQQYEYPNGSIIAVAGMDDADKIQSSEWDMAYVQEATELTVNDWEVLTKCLRNKQMPYQQLIADCNPSYPTHWLKQRCDRGATLMLDSRHEDNPSITDEDIAVLEALTGVRYLRLRKGIWAAAEGMVYESWDSALHKVSEAKLREWGIIL